VRGFQPEDLDLVRLLDGYGVHGVVDVDVMDVEDQAVGRGLGLRTLQLHIVDNKPPSVDDILSMVQFVRSTVVIRPDGRVANVVYMHDETGRGPVVVVAAMLQLLRGVGLPTVLRQLSTDKAGQISAEQLLALRDVDAVVHGRTEPGSYTVLHGVTW
jgi:hypothetical protein